VTAAVVALEEDGRGQPPQAATARASGLCGRLPARFAAPQRLCIVVHVGSHYQAREAGATPEVRPLIAGGRLFWIDIVGRDEKARATFIHAA